MWNGTTSATARRTRLQDLKGLFAHGFEGRLTRWLSCYMHHSVAALFIVVIFASTGRGEANPTDGAKDSSILELARMGAGISIINTDEAVATARIALTPEVYSSTAIDIIARINSSVSLTLRSGVAIDDASCYRLASHRHLVHLTLPGSGVSPDGLVALMDSSCLKSLDLSDRNLTKENIEGFGCLPRLRRLGLDRSVLTDAQWRTIASSSHLLEELSCEGVALSTEAWKAIRSIPRLRSLAIGGEGLAQRDFEQLGKLAALEAVAIHDAEIGYAHLLPLSQLQRLKALDLNGSLLDEYCLRAIGEVRSLHELNLGRTPIRGQHMISLTKLPHLRTLVLKESQIDDDSLRIISTLRGLTSLDIERCAAVTDDGLLSLATLVGLEELRASNSQLTDRGIAVASQMPGLRVLLAGGNAISAEAMGVLLRCNHLHELRLRYPEQDRPTEFVFSIMKSIARIESLEVLDVSGLQQNEKSLSPLERLLLLEDLTLCESGLDDSAVKSLRSLKSLRCLDIRFNRDVGDGAVDSLLGCDQLKAVWVAGCGFTDDGIKRLGAAVVVHKPVGTNVILVNPVVRPVMQR